MGSLSDEDSSGLRCRLRLGMVMGDGDELAVDVEELLEGSVERADVLRLRNRILERLENRLVPLFRKRLWDWAESRLPEETDDFEKEFARRCDRNGDAIESLEWLSPHVPTDEEHSWQERMVEILIAREENERVR